MGICWDLQSCWDLGENCCILVLLFNFFLPFEGKLLVSDIFKGISGKLKKFEKLLHQKLDVKNEFLPKKVYQLNMDI